MKIIDKQYSNLEKPIEIIQIKLNATEFKLQFISRIEAYQFTQQEHTGTHMDAPLHFVENGRPIDQIPMEQLAGNGKMNSSFLYHLGGLSMPQGLLAHMCIPPSRRATLM